MHDILSEGDRTVVRCSGRATYKGGLLDIPSEDQRVLETSILILRIESGLVKEIWSEMSDLQLGAFPVPDQSR